MKRELKAFYNLTSVNGRNRFKMFCDEVLISLIYLSPVIYGTDTLSVFRPESISFLVLSNRRIDLVHKERAHASCVLLCIS